ncbi:MAG: adenylosuccinate synthetase [Patescibacteria group bacterium]
MKNNKNLDKRPLSVSIEDAFFGDSGKGAVIAKINRIYSKKYKLYTLRYNGGGNAGHEAEIDGKMVVTHHLPMGVMQENSTSIIGRGMLIHPEDLLLEIEWTKKLFGGVPGKLLIDENTILSLDTHRALETVLNVFTSGGRGSTGRGIATGYASFYERHALMVKDLMGNNWKKIFSDHYKLYENFTRGFGKDYELKNVLVITLNPEKKRRAGTEKEFLTRLGQAREKIKKYISDDIYSILTKVWQDPKIAFTIEGAQGAALDPFHGVYPDVTASRCLSRFINDSTYNVILPEDISYRLAVMKTTYMSSVGIRKLPTLFDPKVVDWIQQSFDERGRSTGRLREIYEISIPIARYIKRAAGYDGLVATHLDASRKNSKIPVVTRYTNGNGEEKPYLPFQASLNLLKPEITNFEGWEGDKVKKAKSPKDLPKETKTYLEFLEKTIAPVLFGTYGPGLSDYILWTDFE